MRIVKIGLMAAGLASLSGCDQYPRDISGTGERIEETGRLRIGLIDGTDAVPAQPVLEQISAHYDATQSLSTGSAEHLIRDLDEQKLDVVVGEFAKASPLAKEVSFSHSIGVPEPADKKIPVLRLARKNGENGLILFTDRITTP
jgi:DNA-binding transcriptional LysR family regulator|tara:strand:- start:19668 stop:20099 length:432 start_codon:yes stop_codon:yes gene_type:complete